MGNFLFSCNLSMICACNITELIDNLIKLIDLGSAKSVKKLLKKLGKMTLISEVISVLSSGFYKLMLDQTGSSVILRCLDLADTWQNKVIPI